jgi:O-antigen/teichoic acid export membrane protein
VDAPAAPDTLARRTVAAARWRVAGSILQGSFQFGVGILLARLLPPSAFGLVALAYVAVGLALLFSEMGLGAALVRTQPLRDAHVRTAFTGSVVLGGVFAALLWSAAPAIGGLVRHDELSTVLRALCPLFVLAAAGSVARALLQRQLDFRALFAVELVSYAGGFAPVAVALALRGHGVWSLVAGMLAQTAIATAMAVALARPPLRPLLGMREFRELGVFGAGSSLVRFANFCAGHLDNLVVGRLLGAHALGLYSRGFNVVNLPLAYLSDPAWHVLYPALAEARDDPARVRRAYLAAVRLSALLAAPVMAGMAVAAPHMVPALYGPGWEGAVLPLQFLCLAGLFRSLYRVSGALAHASGHVYAEAARQGAFAVLVVAGAVLGARAGGVGGVGAGVAGAGFFMYLAMSHLSLRVLGCGWRAFAREQLPGAGVGVLVGAAALGARAWAESAGASHGAAFALVLAACVLASPAALFFVPPAVLPAAVRERLRVAPALRGALHRLRAALT